MTMKDTTRLTVFKASAGSGKTYRLALEYIKLLMADPKNFRYTLAVTFTNKATEEMKTRILSKLFALAHRLSSGDDYVKELHHSMPQLSDNDIQQRATLALDGILNAYHYFRVETIDSFFQRILRNLARELGLKANINVGLNDREVEQQAVDEIIENINSDKDPLLGWMMDFVNERLDEDKNWNVIGQIKDFGTNIYRDFYKERHEQLEAILSNPQFFKNYTGKLRAKAAQVDKDMSALADRFQTLVDQYGFDDSDFTRATVPNYFKKLREGNYCDVAHATIDKAGTDEWTKLIKKAIKDTDKGQTFHEQIAPLITKTEQLRQKAERVKYSVELTLRNLNELRLLGRIAQQVDAINADNNNFPLSNTQQLIKDMIDGSDTPFIYEKIGGSLKYIMIDEFQDTSAVQWDNFKVLIDDCIAHQAGSLIVGDVKQSIYRWRGGDWRLLQDLTHDKHPEIKEVKLDTNFRSQPKIITFNNMFFKLAAKKTTETAVAELNDHHAPKDVIQQALDIETAYQDVEQAYPKGKELVGMAQIKLLDDEDYDQETLDQIESTIAELLKAGVATKDIAVLVRKNKHIQAIAEYFMQHQIMVDGKPANVSLVSDEAFRLDASLAVRMLIGALRYLVHPDDKLTTAFLVKAYHRIGGEVKEEEDKDGKEDERPKEVVIDKDDANLDTRLFVGKDDIATQLPEALRTQRDELRGEPLMMLFKHLYAILGLERLDDESAYVCAFLDKVAALIHSKAVGIEDVLNAWDTDLCGKAIHSDDINGIRLMTIHKSKGLEFANVIIPYCDWDIERNNDTLWFTTDDKPEPFNELPLVPVSLQSKKLKNSIYSDDYDREHLKNIVDNLNLIYVAFTRAKCNLYVFGKKSPKAPYPSKIIQDVAEDLKQECTIEEDDKTTTITYGEFCPTPKKSEDKDTENVFLVDDEPLRVKIKNYPEIYEFKESNDCKAFIMPQDDEDAQMRRAYIETGNIIHELLSHIRDVNDIDRAINNMEFSGVLYEKPMTRESLRAMVHQLIESPVPKTWFRPGLKVMNECEIICYSKKDGTVVPKRPDRVIDDGNAVTVIDFKTGAPRAKHVEQVQNYMQLLSEIGYSNVKGYLWYLRTNTVRAV